MKNKIRPGPGTPLMAQSSVVPNVCEEDYAINVPGRSLFFLFFILMHDIVWAPRKRDICAQTQGTVSLQRSVRAQVPCDVVRIRMRKKKTGTCRIFSFGDLGRFMRL